mmetsp:Transcript_32229/g.51329  ORF Transcript_32229/g.51329 Transcript_32229/m.51329 type:complete len:81 (+) Transcript_32229:428-670(+)
MEILRCQTLNDDGEGRTCNQRKKLYVVWLIYSRLFQDSLYIYKYLLGVLGSKSLSEFIHWVFWRHWLGSGGFLDCVIRIS